MVVPLQSLFWSVILSTMMASHIGHFCGRFVDQPYWLVPWSLRQTALFFSHFLWSVLFLFCGHANLMRPFLSRGSLFWVDCILCEVDKIQTAHQELWPEESLQGLLLSLSPHLPSHLPEVPPPVNRLSQKENYNTHTHTQSFMELLHLLTFVVWCYVSTELIFKTPIVIRKHVVWCQQLKQSWFPMI